MGSVKLISDKKLIEKVYIKLQGEICTLPQYMYNDDENEKISFLYYKSDRIGGLCFGVLSREKNIFYLRYLRMTYDYSKPLFIKDFIEKFFNYIKIKYNVNKIIIVTKQDDDSESFLTNLIEEIRWCKIEDVAYLRHVGVNTCDFDHFRKNRWYCPELLEKKGYAAVKISEYPKDWQIELIEKEKLHNVPDDYLSPGIWENYFDYDPDTSYVLLKKGDNRPCGWIVTQREENDVIKLRRFFIYKKERRACMGPAFSTWVLDEIEKKCRQLQFEVAKGNRQMEMFTECYCKSILAFSYYKVDITVRI